MKNTSQILNTKKVPHQHYDKSFYNYFNQSEIYTLSDPMPDIDHVVSIIVDGNISNLTICSTTKGHSMAGNIFTDQQLRVEIEWMVKILYATNHDIQKVHVFEQRTSTYMYTPIPNHLEGSDLRDLFRSGYLKADLYIDKATATKVNHRQIFKDIHMLLKLYLIPTYQLTYTKHRDRHQSQLFLSHHDGKHEYLVHSADMDKFIKPKWSPKGNKIAYLGTKGKAYILYTYHLQSSTHRQITDTRLLKSISSYDWSKDGHHIVASALFDGGKELFSIDMNTLSCQQLTYGNGLSKSFYPKCSPDGNKIAFLRSFSGVTHLYIMDQTGLNCKQVTDISGIKDFDWSPNGESIVYIIGKDNKADQIYLWHLDTDTHQLVTSDDDVYDKTAIQFSPQQNLFAFKGSQFDTENLFVFNLKSKTFKNITQHYKNIQISDFIWQIDGHSLYYTANDLYFYNIYSITLKNLDRQQLTNTKATTIELSYRPKLT